MSVDCAKGLGLGFGGYVSVHIVQRDSDSEGMMPARVVQRDSGSSVITVRLTCYIYPSRRLMTAPAKVQVLETKIRSPTAAL